MPGSSGGHRSHRKLFEAHRSHLGPWSWALGKSTLPKMFPKHQHWRLRRRRRRRRLQYYLRALRRTFFCAPLLPTVMVSTFSLAPLSKTQQGRVGRPGFCAFVSGRSGRVRGVWRGAGCIGVGVALGAGMSKTIIMIFQGFRQPELQEKTLKITGKSS